MAAMDLEDCKLLEALRDAWKLVQFMETDEGRRISETTELGLKARKHFSELLMEASKRELHYMECLQ